MGKPQYNHYSPVFANGPWAEGSHYACWKRQSDEGIVIQEPKGRKQWGRQRRLYSSSIEVALDRDIEASVSPIYRKLLNFQEPLEYERIKWAQFLRSQIVRTPSFMRYERAAKNMLGMHNEPDHDRVGCEECHDLVEITGRRWLLLLAHDDDFFIRTDNPVLYTGFLSDPATVLYYPLSPRLCFVATTMGTDWDPQNKSLTQVSMVNMPLLKGAAHMLNFYFAKFADESLVLRPSDSGTIAQEMFSDVLGIYPQPPFDLHRPQAHEIAEAMESIRSLMSVVDGHKYPEHSVDELPGFESI